MTNGRAYSKSDDEEEGEEEGGVFDETAVLITLCAFELLELSWYSGVDFQLRKNAVIYKTNRTIVSQPF